MLTLINDGIDLFFSDDVSGTLGKSPSVPLQESNPRPSDYTFGCSTSELQETRGSENIVTRKYSEVLGRNPSAPLQEPNPRAPDYEFEGSTSEL